MSVEDHYVEGANLSHVWGRLFLRAISPGVTEIIPSVVSVSGDLQEQVPEDSGIRRTLDDVLVEAGKNACGTTASTIFPVSLWNRRRRREVLFLRYARIYPRIAKCPSNRYGVYFHRLISYGQASSVVNQLDRITDIYRSGNHRRSALQAAVYDPTTDLTNQRQRGFPCLQHVIFTPSGSSDLAVTGFYATQLLFERAYGNYLGLCHLGQFMAQEMGLRLTRMTCVTAVARYAEVPKCDLAHLTRAVSEHIPDA